MRIRLATVEDASAIGELHVRSREFAYRGLMPDESLDRTIAARDDRIARWRSNLATAGPDVRCWLAEDDDVVVGFASTGASRDGDAAPYTGEVLAIYLDPVVIGRGMGRTLFQHAIDDLLRRGFAPLTLWVLDENQRARHFYEAAGWFADGATKAEEMSGAVLQEVRYRLDPGMHRDETRTT